MDDAALGGATLGTVVSPGPQFIYIVARKELGGAAAIVQACHAATECLVPMWLPLKKDTRIAFLAATKAQMAAVVERLGQNELHYEAIIENDGPLKGSTTAVGVYGAKEFIEHLMVDAEGKPLPKFKLNADAQFNLGVEAAASLVEKGWEAGQDEALVAGIRALKRPEK